MTTVSLNFKRRGGRTETEGLSEEGHGDLEHRHRASIEWKDFLANRDWDSVLEYYRHAVNHPTLARSPDFVVSGAGSGGADWFGVLDPAREAVKSGNGRDRRSTFLVEIDYVGTGFQGVQVNHGIRTVLGAIREGLEGLLGKDAPKAIAMAGRTDAGVHAIGQVLSFSTWGSTSEDEIAAALGKVACNEIRVARVANVHRSFHANFGATWRRYMYLFPLNTRPDGSEDVDCGRVQRQLEHISREPLHFNALAFASIRNWEARSDVDVCTLLHTSARRVQIGADPTAPALLVELTADRFLRRMVRILVSSAIRAARHHADDRELRRIVLEGKREGAALPAPPEGLCMVGVGYDSYDTSQGGAAIRNAPSTQEPPQSQPGPSAGGRASCDHGDPAQAARRDGT